MSKKLEENQRAWKDDDYLYEFRQQLKNQIIHWPLNAGFEKEKGDLINLIKRAVFDKKSNSALLIGPPGSGKTMLIRDVLDQMSCEKKFKGSTIIVKLNGLIHTDDRLALIAISRQMNLENVVEDRVTGSFADNMTLLIETLNAGDKEKAIVFILEEVGLFCNHHNQTLLYNLFDIAHSNKAAVFVLGVTAHMDVVDLMEKRVKSRFSHRRIHLLPGSNEETFQARIEMCKSMLKLESRYKSADIKWSNSVDKVLEARTPVYMLLKNLFDIDNREQAIRDFLLQVVCIMNLENMELTEEPFKIVHKEISGDDRLKMVNGLSVLEVCLVVAMKQLVTIYQGEPFNFEMVYRRFHNFSKRSSMDQVPRDVVQKTFEHLQAIEIVTPVRRTAGASRVQREFQLQNFQLLPHQVMDLLNHSKELPTNVMEWASENLV